MYNHVVQSHHEKKEVTSQSHSSQSIWMSHWARTSYKMEPPQIHQPVNNKGKDKLFPFFGGPDTSLDVSSNYRKESNVVPFAGTTNITDIQKSVDMISRYSRNETLPQDSNDMLTVNDNRSTIYYGQAMEPPKTGLELASPVRKQNWLMWNPSAAVASQERETNINIADMSDDLKRQVKSNVLSSNFKHVPYRTNFHEDGAFGEHGGSSSGLAVKGHFGNSSRPTKLDSNHINLQGGSALFVHPQNSGHPCVSETRRNDIGLGMDGPSTSKNHLSFLVDGTNKKGLDHLSSKYSRSEDKCLEYTSYNRDVSGTGNQVLFTEKDNLGPCRSVQYSGSRFGEFFRLSDRGFQKPQGLKLQPLWSSTDSEENGKTLINNSATAKNEASAETDTMDMDILNGEESSASEKEIAGSLKLQLSQAAETSTRVAGDDDHHGGDGNLSRPAMSRFTNGAASSRTLSFDLGQLLPYGFQIKDSKYKSGFSSGEGGPGSESRWVKRLKTDSLSHFHGTKSLKMDETETIDPREKMMNGSFGERMKQGSESHDKERVEFLEQSRLLLRDGNSSMERSQEDLLSDSWIRRWCRNQAPLQKKPIDLSSSSCEPQTVNASFDELNKKQFPSVAAMALMGKAMNGFQQCEFSKKGSFVVWNSKGL